MESDRAAASDTPAPGLTPRFGTSSTTVGSAVVVLVIGELDLLAAPQLLALIDQHREDPAVQLVVVDLSQVEFLGSSGLGVLAEIATRATPSRPSTEQFVTGQVDRPGRAVPVRLVAPPSHQPVVRPWMMMNLQQIVPLHSTVRDALDAG